MKVNHTQVFPCSGSRYILMLLCVVVLWLMFLQHDVNLSWVGAQVCIHKCTAYLSPGRSRTEAEISAASGHSFSTSSRGPHRDLLKPRKDFFTAERREKETQTANKNLGMTSFMWEANTNTIVQLRHRILISWEVPLTFEAMFEAVLHDDKELLERWVVRVQSSSEAQSRLDQPFNTQLGHVQQVCSLHGHGVSQGCRTKATHRYLT